MDNDEIVIGLPHNEMVGVCYSLRIERNYASLGEYISSTRPLVTLGIANGDWDMRRANFPLKRSHSKRYTRHLSYKSPMERVCLSGKNAHSFH
jgi:hypothetical protein